MAADEEVDVVYVATINTTHLAVCTMVLDKGKPVLCEKPLAMNISDTEKLLKTAQEKGIFFMEAIWSRYFPAMVELRQMISEGEIGEVRYVNAKLCVRVGPSANLSDPKLGGGALLNFGVYCLSFASMVFGGETPESIHAWGQLTKEGTDELAAITMIYKGGRIAQLTCSRVINMTCEGVVCGTKGDVKILDYVLCPTKLESSAGVKKEYPLPKTTLPLNYLNSTGLRYEAEEVRRCLAEGKKESDVMPHKESLLMAKMMEEALKQIGVEY